MNGISRRRSGAAAAALNEVTNWVEALEGRRMFASVTLAGGELTVQGNTTTANAMTVSARNGQLQATVNTTTRSFAASAVSKIRLVAGSAGDRMTVDSGVTVGAIVEGGAGKDTVVGGGGNDTILGLGGNDSLVGGNGNDQEFGGAGNDTVNGSAGNDTIFGDASNDIVDGGAGSNVALGGTGTNKVFSDRGIRALPTTTGPTLNVRDFGAVLDGTTNDAPAINRAIAALPAAGGIIAIPGLAGVAGEGVQLSGRSNVRIVGTAAGAGIKLLNVPVVEGYGNTGMLVTSCTDCSVENLVVDGNSQACSPLALWKNTRVTVQGNTFKNGNGSGSLFATGDQSDQYLNNTVLNSVGTCRGLWIGNATAAPGDVDTDALISGNVISGTGGTGIAGAVVGGRVLDNKVTGTGGSGIALGGYTGGRSTNSVVAENVCTGNAFHGIQADDWAPATPIDNMVIANNVCSGNLNSGVYAIHVKNWTIVGNTADDNNVDVGGASAGVLLADVTGVVAADNTTADTHAAAQRTQTQGIGLDAWNATFNCRQVDILYNRTSGNRQAGIYLETQTNAGSTGLIDRVRIEGNSSTGNSGYGLFMWQVRPSTITNVTLSRNTYSSNGQGSVLTNVP